LFIRMKFGMRQRVAIAMMTLGRFPGRRSANGKPVRATEICSNKDEWGTQAQDDR
jgi:hypothetical protein